MSESLTSLNEQLSNASASLNHWNRRVSNYEAEAERMRQVARNLDAEVGKLHNLFMPIRHVHTAQTWEGNAATRSRQRLDGHEARLGTAVQQLNAIIGDLGAEARVSDGSAAAAKQSRDHYAREARGLRLEIMNENSNTYA